MKNETWEDHIGPEGGDAVSLESLGTATHIGTPELFKGAAPYLGENVQDQLDGMENTNAINSPTKVSGKAPAEKGESV